MGLAPRWRLSVKVRAAWAIVLAGYSALVALVLVLDRALKETTWPWIHSNRLLVWLAGILAVVTLADAAKRAVHRVGASKAQANSIRIRNQLSTIIVTTCEIHGIPVSQVGCGLFLIQERGVKRPRRLLRVERVRLVNDLQETKVVFTKGKGAVGKCWDDSHWVHHDWSNTNARFAHHRDEVKRRWDDLSAAVTHGFDREEFVSMLGKYTEVLVVPVMINSKFEGCIALDRRWQDGQTTTNNPRFNNEATRAVLGAAATTLEPLLKK